MIALILAAGDQSRWAGPFPKQLCDVAGETLLTRTQRQLAERGVENAVIARDPWLLAYADRWHIPTAYRWICETLLSTLLLWDQQTAVLLGDVAYSDAAIDRILYTYQPLAVFGQVARSGYRDEEIFALSMRGGRRQAQKALERAVSLAGVGQGDGKLWDFYRAYCHLGPGEMEDTVFVRIDDYTTDFDTLEQYQEWMRRHTWAALRSPRIAQIASQLSRQPSAGPR